MTPAVLMQSIKAANDELQVAELERDLIQAERDDVLTGAANARGPRGVPRDAFAPPRGPLGPSPDRESGIGNAPALAPGPFGSTVRPAAAH
jgi:hypothetical protein